MPLTSSLTRSDSINSLNLSNSIIFCFYSQFSNMFKLVVFTNAIKLFILKGSCASSAGISSGLLIWTMTPVLPVGIAVICSQLNVQKIKFYIDTNIGSRPKLCHSRSEHNLIESVPGWRWFDFSNSLWKLLKTIWFKLTNQ